MPSISSASDEEIMKVVAAIALVAISSFASTAPASAQNKLKECASQWNALKAANQTEGKSYRDFQKSCMGKTNDLARDAGAADVKKSDTAKTKSAKSKTAKAKTSSGGREVANARRKECGAEWKADKAAGKVEAGMKWPQYWSACNKRKKATAA
jgi:hypothetical protein